MVSGDPIQAAAQSSILGFGFSRSTCLYSSHMLNGCGCRTLPVLRRRRKQTQRELEKTFAPSAPVRASLVGFSRHEERHQRHVVRVDLVTASFFSRLCYRIIIGDATMACASSARRNAKPSGAKNRSGRAQLDGRKSCEHAIHSGGCRLCTGFGTTLRKGISK